jgi:hypothetical protein
VNNSILEWIRREANRTAKLAFWLLIFPCVAQAGVFNVTTAEELQAALVVAGSNSSENRIVLAKGTYDGNFKYIAEHSFSLEIVGQSAKDTLLDGGNRAYALFLSLGDFNPEITISRITLRGGKAKTGAAIRISSERTEPFFSWSPEFHPRVMLSALEIHNNFGGVGGALTGSVIHGVGTILTIEKTQISDNTSLATIQCSDSCDLTISDSVIDGAKKSASVDKSEINVGSIFIENSVISNIELESLGFNGGSSEIGCSLVRSRFEGSGFLDCNSAKRFFVDSSTIHVTAKFGGGGTIINSQFASNNNLSLRGEAIQLLGSLFAPQFDANGGGGTLEFSNYKALDVLSNTITDLSLMKLTPDSSGSSHTLGNNIVVSRRTNGLSPILQEEFPEKSRLISNILPEGDHGVWDENDGNFVLIPEFFDPQGFDFRLVEGARGVNGGSNDLLLEEQLVDLDGNPRVLDGLVDIGAYERSTSALHPADTNGDNAISQSEFDAYNVAWRTNESWPAGPELIPVDFVTRAGYLLQKGGAYKNIGVGKPATWVPVNE